MSGKSNGTKHRSMWDTMTDIGWRRHPACSLSNSTDLNLMCPSINLNWSQRTSQPQPPANKLGSASVLMHRSIRAYSVQIVGVFVCLWNESVALGICFSGVTSTFWRPHIKPMWVACGLSPVNSLHLSLSAPTRISPVHVGQQFTPEQQHAVIKSGGKPQVSLIVQNDQLRNNCLNVWLWWDLVFMCYIRALNHF